MQPGIIFHFAYLYEYVCVCAFNKKNSSKPQELSYYKSMTD